MLDSLCGAIPTGKGGNPELIRESQRRRFADVQLVDKVIELDAKWRDGNAALLLPHSSFFCTAWLAGPCETNTALLDDAAVYKMERLKTEFNALNKEIGRLRKVHAIAMRMC